MSLYYRFIIFFKKEIITGRKNYVLSVDAANVEMMGYKKWLIDKIKLAE